jgi:hypothetical protein
VPRQRQRPVHAQNRQDVGEVGGEPVDPVGVHVGAGRTAVSAVIVGDDSHAVAPPADQVTDLKCPAGLRQAQAVQQDDGVFAGTGGAVVTDRQPHAVTGDHRALDIAIARGRQSLRASGSCPTVRV